VTKRAVRVRAATHADEAALVVLWGELLAAHARAAPRFFRVPDGDGQAREEVRRALDGALAGGEEVLVAERAEELIGLVHVALYDTPRAPSKVPRRRANVEEIVVTRPARRRGAGRLLMAAASSWARERDAEELVLTVWSGNRGAAAFYRALGYRPVNVVMARRITDTDPG
jgi:ribosomal protein S18 acetylase RimI-like enzyme